ncbi:vesicle-associated protein 1-3-like [Impatiens glandulifera]|uniref:vesicle-associated protein 1-3-like n=1 Tax=Impatiens glandulifera TaxID=253017 RepID=UPI001FB181BB|nr:vesicle-associated protein 1-3-like [Impatiens glandulifera]
MTTAAADLLHLPPELKFSLELNKQTSCLMTLTNKTDQHVAFKVKTTSPKNYCVRPNNGLVLPGSSCSVTVTMQAQKELPSEYMQCKDKFLVQSVLVPNEVAAKTDDTVNFFEKADGKVFGDYKLRVVYLPPTTIEEGLSPKVNRNKASFSDTDGNASSSQAFSLMSRLTDEKADAILENQKLRRELDLMRIEIGKKNGGSGFSMLLVVLFGLIGVLVGYILNRRS